MANASDYPAQWLLPPSHSVPTTPLEQLQIAADAKASRIASGQESMTQTTAVNPFTGAAIRGGAGGSKVAAALMNPVGDGSTWQQFDDQVSDPNSWSPRRVAAVPATVDGANPLDVTRLGLTNDPFRTAAEQAAATEGAGGTVVTAHGAGPFSGARAGIAGRSPAPITLGGTITEGDPWGGMRIGAPPAGHSGMVVGTPTPTVRSVIAARQSAPAAVQVISPEVHAALMAQQSPDQRGIEAARASGMIDQFGMLTGSGGHSMWGSH